MKNPLLVLTILSVITVVSHAQVDFQLNPTYCLNEKVSPVVQNNQYSNFEWDFCVEKFSDALSVDFSADITGGGRNLGIDFFKQGDVWYAIATSWSENKIFRLEFLNGLSNPPTAISDLGNPGGLLNQPVSIGLIKRDGFTYALIQNWANNSLVRIKFEDGINGVTRSSNLVYSSFGTSLSKMEIIDNESELKAIAIIPNSSIHIIDFQNDINKVIGTGDVLKTNPISGLFDTREIEMIKDGGNWYAFIASYEGTISRVDFGSEIMTGIKGFELNVTSNIYDGGFINNIEIIKNQCEFHLHVATYQGDLFKVNLGSNILTNAINTGSVQYETTGGYSQGYAMKFVRDESQWHGYVVNDISAKLYEISNTTPCSASIPYSNEETPVVTFQTNGSFPIGLLNFDLNGNSISACKEVTVLFSVAPAIDFFSQNVCSNDDINFTSTNSSQDITDYSWSFGDTQSSIDPTPTHQYSSAGDYNVTLQVTAENGCNNYVEKTISIYDEPIPDFRIPIANPLCTNQNYVFDNRSTIDPGYPVTWQWKVNGVDESATEDLNYTFTQVENQTVTLSASIPGCENSITKPISTLAEGSLADFTFPAIRCEEDVIAFTNTTIGTVTGYQWNFGDGNTSTDVNSQNIFTAPAVYDVTLSASNAAGCNNFVTKQLRVFSKPAVAFSTSNLCNDQDAMFSDTTIPPTDSNVQLREWNFGDATSGQNASTLQNPLHTFATAGDYTVALTVTTSASCSTTLEQPVTIKPSPVPDFTNSTPCADEDVNFLGSSSGVIAIWDWQIGNVQTGYRFGNQPGITYPKISPGNYTAKLSVTADNGCFNFEEKPIEVKNKLAPDFSFLKNCINEQTIFTDITNATADPISTYQWSVAGGGTATESPAIFTFSTNSTRSVTLTVVTESGCDYSKTKQVPIIDAPHASFEAFPPSGGVPLLVQFTNTSAGAVSYVWKFKENAITTAGSPSFTYNDVGQYEAELTAYNAQFCSDVVSMTITAEEVREEIALMNLKLRALSNAPIKPSVTIVNNGNVSLNNLALLFDISGVVVKEYVDKSIRADSSWVHVVKFEVPASQELEFICAEVENMDDVIASDNKVCLNIEDVFKSFTPYPNPTNDQINVEWILNEEGMVTVSLVNSMGLQVKNFEIEAPEGFSPFMVDTEGLSAGVYLVRVTSKGISRAYKVVIQ